MTMSWQEAAQTVRSEIEAAIPSIWRLPESFASGSRDVRSVSARCGILSKEQIGITIQGTASVARRLAAGKLSAVQVVEVVCARAAFAHQLVRMQSST